MSEPVETTKIRIETLKECASIICQGCRKKWKYTSDDYRTHRVPTYGEEFFECETPATMRHRLKTLEDSIALIWSVIFENQTFTICTANEDELPDPDLVETEDQIIVYVRAQHSIDALKQAEQRRAEFLKPKDLE